jgi:signal transduction histidine kinase
VSVDELSRLLEEHAALRRVATLVARGAPADELFAAATEEVGRVLGVDVAHLDRYGSDGSVTVVAAWSATGDHLPAVGIRWSTGGNNLSTRVIDSCRPARIDSYADASGAPGIAAREAGHRSAVATPIAVDGRLWGAMSVVSLLEEPLPADTEVRLADFTDLLATAIANAGSRSDLARLAEEHAALRRVATLVAGEVPGNELFAAVAEEAGRLLGVELVALCRYGSDDTVTLVAGWSRVDGDLPALESTWALEGDNVPTLVARTGRPARLDGLEDASTPIGVAIREAGVRSVVGTPVVVDGRLWGMIAAGSNSDEPLPPDTEARLGAFTDLLATAIANAGSRAELAASRARIVAAADDARRRIERDLHDGAQQRLVALGLMLRDVQAAIPAGLDELNGEVERIARGLTRVQDGLREIARGIHPAILAHGGLGPVLKTVARRSPLPIELEVRCLGRLPEQVEVAAYYVVSEALTNAAKHARASLVQVEVEACDGVLRARISDDGVGGADPSRGSGLVGLKDRVETLGGTIILHSQAGAGTSLHVEIPIGD